MSQSVWWKVTLLKFYNTILTLLVSMVCLQKFPANILPCLKFKVCHTQLIGIWSSTICDCSNKLVTSHRWSRHVWEMREAGETKNMLQTCKNYHICAWRSLSFFTVCLSRALFLSLSVVSVSNSNTHIHTHTHTHAHPTGHQHPSNPLCDHMKMSTECQNVLQL